MKLNVYTVLLRCHFVAAAVIQYFVNNSTDGGRFPSRPPNPRLQ